MHSMKSQHAERIGKQTPRFEHIPTSARVFDVGRDAVDLIASAGKPLDPWQERTLINAMAEKEPGRFASFEVGLIVPRQNGKNVIIEARELYGLFLDPTCKVITHSAQLFETARKAFGELEEIIRSTPFLFKRVLGADRAHDSHEKVSGIRTGAGEMTIILANGSRINYRSRSRDGGRGLTGDLIIIDEAYDLTAEEVAAMMPTMAARTREGNPQIFYTSSAGMLASDQLEKIRARGMAGGEPALYFAEWSASEDADSGDVDAWYEANPALGVRISEEYVRDVELAQMGEEQFRRERLGIWAKVGDDAAISKREWARLEDRSVTKEDGERLAFAVDVPPSRDYATIACAIMLDDSRTYVEVVDQRPGTDWVASRVAELKERWSPVAVVVEAGSGAGSLVREMQAVRVRPHLITGRQYFQACGAFYDMVRQKKVAHFGQEHLDRAVEASTMKFVGDSLFKWVRRSQVEDISPLVAVTLAVEGLSVGRDSGKARQGWRIAAL